MKHFLRELSRWVLVLSAVALVAGPVAAQDIPAGDDTWATPGGGDTWVELNGADWATICGVTNGGPQQILFKGVTLQGQGDGSVVVTRLQDAVFDPTGVAQVPVVVRVLQFKSESTTSTPCGNLDFQVRLNGRQSTAQMEIRRESSSGGHFFVDLPVNAAVDAIDPSNGNVVGSVIKEGLLLEPATGTPWNYTAPKFALDPNAPWFPGVNSSGQRVTVVRHHQFPAQHAYRPVTYCKTGTVGTASANSSDTAVESGLCPVQIEPAATESASGTR